MKALFGLSSYSLIFLGALEDSSDFSLVLAIVRKMWRPHAVPVTLMECKRMLLILLIVSFYKFRDNLLGALFESFGYYLISFWVPYELSILSLALGFVQKMW